MNPEEAAPTTVGGAINQLPQAPKAQVARWKQLVDSYLRGRTVLKRACLLIDARHGLKDSDREVMTMLDKAAVTYQVVLTKADKIKAGALA